MGGQQYEIVFVNVNDYESESNWKRDLDRLISVLNQEKHVWIGFKRVYAADVRKYAFGSYPLLADGQRAWLRIVQDHYDPSLYNKDYGTPQGAYTTISTANGPIYKRQFTKATVWVNPGDVTRTGKTLATHSAIIEMK